MLRPQADEPSPKLAAQTCGGSSSTVLYHGCIAPHGQVNMTRAAPTVWARPHDQDVRTLVVKGGLEGNRLVQLAVHQTLLNVR